MRSYGLPAEEELAADYQSGHTGLVRWLVRSFPRLADQAEDILQATFLELLQRIREQDFHPVVGWLGTIRQLARLRALDRLRAWEFRVFKQIAAGYAREEGSAESAGPAEVADSASTPVSRLASAERRARQGLLLSEVLEEFCRWCEAVPNRIAVRHVYERSLRGQLPTEIARDLGFPANRVHGLLHQARQWVYERIRRRDVDRSVFLTLYRGKGGESPQTRNETVLRGDRPGAKTLGAEPHRAGGRSRGRDPAVGSEGPESELAASMPKLQSFAEVVCWVIEELGAICPSRDRLLQFARQQGAQEFADVHYHVMIANCGLCRAELEAEGFSL